jgi:hypothetical protein
MTDSIRLAAGTVTAFDLLTTDSYLVTQYTRTSDMTPAMHWLATQPEGAELKRQWRGGFEVGSGNWYGGFNGALVFSILTIGMRDTIENTLLGGKGVAKVTAYLHAPQAAQSQEMIVVLGELVSPFRQESDTYTYFDGKLYHTVRYDFRRGSEVTLQVLATEDDNILTTESGAWIVLG